MIYQSCNWVKRAFQARQIEPWQVYYTKRRGQNSQQLRKFVRISLFFSGGQLISCFNRIFQLETNTDIKLLAIYLTDDLKWKKQTQEMVKQANLSILSLKLLARRDVPTPYLLDSFLMFIRPRLECASSVWHYGLISDPILSYSGSF